MSRLSLRRLALMCSVLLVPAVALAQTTNAPATRKVKVLQPAPGASWSQLPPLEGGDVKAFVSVGKKVFALGEELFESANGGLAWTQVPTFAPAPVTQIATDGKLLWAGVGDDRLFTTADGASWTEVPFCEVTWIAPVEGDERAAKRCKIKGLDSGPNRVVVSAEHGIYVSGARKWSRLPVPAYSSSVVAVTAAATFVSDIDQDRLLRVAGGTATPVKADGYGIRRMVEIGSTLVADGQKVDSYDDEAHGPNFAYAVLVSTDGGKTFKAHKAPGNDVRALAGSGGVLWLSTEEAVYESRDMGKSWKRTAASYSSLIEPVGGALLLARDAPERFDLKTRAVKPTRGYRNAPPGTITGAGEAVITTSQHQDYWRCEKGDCERIGVCGDEWTAAHDGTLFRIEEVQNATKVTAARAGGNSEDEDDDEKETPKQKRLLVSRDGWKTWTESTVKLRNFADVDAVGGSHGSYAWAGGYVSVSADGLAWEDRAASYRDTISSLLEGGPGISEMSAARAFVDNGGAVVARQGDDLFVASRRTGSCVASTDRGRTFSRISGLPKGVWVLHVGIDGLTAVVVTEKGVLRSTRKPGGKWTAFSDVETFAENEAVKAVVQRGTQLWAVRSKGVLVSNDLGDTWSEMQSPGKWVDDVALAGGDLYVTAALESGAKRMWRLPLQEVEVQIPAGEP